MPARSNLCLLIILILANAARGEQVLSALPGPADLDVARGFHVERLCLVPRELGSWVSMAFDDRQRIIVSHEGGGLYRVTPSPLGEPAQPTTVERLQVKLDGAQGLLHTGKALYAVSRGLHRLQDTNSDGQFDSVKLLLDIPGKGEHGPHAVVMGPDQKWLYVIAGNATPLPEQFTKRRVVAVPGADTYAKDAAQGWVIRVTPDGRQQELMCVGLRNSYGLAFNADGELFTFDSDNEGYMNLPWYRPTNIYHLVSGADFGWRQGPTTRQTYYPDNLPPVLEVGPGSPTGMAFGTGAAFPEEYQRALFACDWSYGRIYAIHLEPYGASYRAKQEFLISGRPLAVTDIRVGGDGALYFITGGRGTQSALYRATWTGEGVNTVRLFKDDPVSSLARRQRRELESHHGVRDDKAVDAVWPHLGSPDRALRYAARVALEHQDVKLWQRRALDEPARFESFDIMLALARQGGPSLRPDVLNKLSGALEAWDSLKPQPRLALLRTHQVCLQRMGPPHGPRAQRLLKQLDKLYPNTDGDVNRELISLLVTLKADDLVERTITVLQQTPSAMRQIHFLRELNRAGAKLSDAHRQQLLSVLDLETIRDTAARDYKDVSAVVTGMLKEIGVGAERPPPAPRTLVRKWQLDELLPQLTKGQLTSRDVRRGREAFRKASCHSCHRIGSTGGVLGPNLTGVGGRFQIRDVLEAILDPDKVVSDQYRTTTFRKTNGEVFTGQIVNLSKGNIQVRLDPLRPFPRVSIPEQEIESMKLSDTSLMPQGLLDYLTRDEILDLMAYLLAEHRGL